MGFLVGIPAIASPAQLHEHHKLFQFLIGIVHVSCKYITFVGSFVLIGGVAVATINIALVKIQATFRANTNLNPPSLKGCNQ